MLRRSGRGAVVAAAAMVSLAAGAPLKPGAGEPPPSGGRRPLTLERVHESPALAGVLPTDLQWQPDGKRLTFLRAGRDGAADLVALEASSGRTTVLVEGARLKLPGLPAAGPAPGLRGDARLPLAGYRWHPDGQRLLVEHGGDLFLVDVRKAAVRALTHSPEAEEIPELSPDGERVAFVRGGDLFAIEFESGRETRLTRSGSDTLLNGKLDWVYYEELADRSWKGFAWSPDSRSIAYLKLDQSRVPSFPIVDFLPLHNEVRLQRYPKAGDPVSVASVGIVTLGKDGAAGPERVSTDVAQDGYVVPQLAWSPDSRTLAYALLNRAQDELALRVLDVPAKLDAPLPAPRTVLTERDPRWVNVLGPPLFLRDGKRFLWLSERDGFPHLYACETSGACRAATQGHFAVEKLLAMDERTGFAWFTSTEKDARERHLYRVRLDGTGKARITTDDGTHDPLLSPDARSYADTHSSATAPPRIFVASADGRRRIVIEDNANAPIRGFETAALEWVDLLAPDGTTLHGRLLKPPGFDPSRRYPVVVLVYGGPHAQTVRDVWSRSYTDQLLAARGFLVWSLDNRGMGARGHGFEVPLHRDLGRIELQDQLLGVEHLKSLPFVDASRIGIYGWSYGGYMTLYAMTHAPSVFKAGVAGAPVTDWRFYDAIYTERYMGRPADNPKGYESSAPRAADLGGELLLIHGTADDNVHLANSVLFADGLLKAGKLYALLLLPRQAHGPTAPESLLARDRAVLRHFETWLKP